MKSPEGTKTEKNVLLSLAGKSQANDTRILLPRRRSRDHEQIAAIFLDTEDNDNEHAKVFFKRLSLYAVQRTSVRFI